MDNLPPGSANDPKAPINNPERICQICGGQMYLFDSGNTRHGTWEAHKCEDCGFVKSNEPIY